jgi:uncharacterized membrane protein YvbJ
MYCQNCGKELPNDANFCLQCGKSVRADVQAAQGGEPVWETCQTTRITVKEGGMLSATQLAYVANALHPKKGKYEAARSAVSKGTDLKAHKTQLDALLQKLTSEGWEYAEQFGGYEYNFKLRRRVR